MFYGTNNHIEPNLGSKPTFQLGLFGRTFALLTSLMLVSLVLWLQVFFNVEQGPRAEQIAQRIASIVSISKTALIHTPANERQTLMLDMSTKESLLVQPFDRTDKRTPLPNSRYWLQVSKHVKDRLGENTHIYWAINNVSGIWVSFRIEDDFFWLMFDRNQLEVASGIEWIGWGGSALILALVGAAISVGFVNRPLAQLAKVARQLAHGENPSPLPEKGPAEIRDMNMAFNRMARDIRQTDADREIMLAGLSHDLRTPLARMRLEIEMSPISDAARIAIDEDLAQINYSIEQLMEYARPASAVPKQGSNVSQAIMEVYARERTYTQLMNGQINASIQPNLYAHISAIDIKRIVVNLIENARRYGRNPSDDVAYIYLTAKQKYEKIIITVGDHGVGIDSSDVDQMLRPFSRGDQARTGVSGAGLGLSIIDRLLRQVGGSFRLTSNKPQGLLAIIELPKARNRLTTGAAFDG